MWRLLHLRRDLGRARRARSNQNWDSAESRLLDAALPLVLAGLVVGIPALGQSPSDGAYRVGPKDLLHIEIMELPELNGEFRVSEAGTINLPLIGDFDVDALTSSDLQLRLKQLLESKYAQRATVSVEVKEYRSKPINVIGAVNRPGPLSIAGRLSLIEALTEAGGLGPNHGGRIYVSRRAGNGLSDQVEISAEDLLVRSDPKVNIPILSHDLINVPATVDLTISFLGELNSPGTKVFKSNERITVLTAIARAGGLTDRAARKILIKRQSRSGGEEQIIVDYKRILAGKDPDLELQRGDVVFVKQSFL